MSEARTFEDVSFEGEPGEIHTRRWKHFLLPSLIETVFKSDTTNYFLGWYLILVGFMPHQPQWLRPQAQALQVPRLPFCS